MAQQTATPKLVKRESADFIGYTESSGTCKFMNKIFQWIQLTLAIKTIHFFAPTHCKYLQPQAHIGLVHHLGQQMRFQLLAYRQLFGILTMSI